MHKLPGSNIIRHGGETGLVFLGAAKASLEL